MLIFFPLAQHYSKVLLRQRCLFITKKGYLLKCKTFKSYTESLNDSLKKMKKNPLYSICDIGPTMDMFDLYFW